MVRMIVSLTEQDKKWLERTSRRDGISSAELVRRAVAALRGVEPACGFRARVALCAGRWKAGRHDAQKDVDAMRDEWDGRT